MSAHNITRYPMPPPPPPVKQQLVTNGISVHGWKVQTTKGPIIADRDSDSFRSIINAGGMPYRDAVGGAITLPEMLFNQSKVVLEHQTSGVRLEFNALDALKAWKEEGLPPLQVKVAQAWQQARQHEIKQQNAIQLEYDWTYTTPYSGTLALASTSNAAPAGLPTQASAAEQAVAKAAAVAEKAADAGATAAAVVLASDDAGKEHSSGGAAASMEAAAAAAAGRAAQAVAQQEAAAAGMAGSGHDISNAGGPIEAQAVVVTDTSASACHTSIVDSSDVVSTVAGSGASPHTSAQDTVHHKLQSTLSCWEQTEEQIDRALLTEREPILFFDEVPLYESDLDDHGVCQLIVKLRVMPKCWFVLLRLWLRVDGSMVRLRETRLFCRLDRPGPVKVIREVKHCEGTFKELRAAGAPGEGPAFSDADTAAGVFQAVAPIGLKKLERSMLLVS